MSGRGRCAALAARIAVLLPLAGPVTGGETARAVAAFRTTRPVQHQEVGLGVVGGIRGLGTGVTLTAFNEAQWLDRKTYERRAVWRGEAKLLLGADIDFGAAYAVTPLLLGQLQAHHVFWLPTEAPPPTFSLGIGPALGLGYRLGGYSAAAGLGTRLDWGRAVGAEERMLSLGLSVMQDLGLAAAPGLAGTTVLFDVGVNPDIWQLVQSEPSPAPVTD